MDPLLLLELFRNITFNFELSEEAKALLTAVCYLMIAIVVLVVLSATSSALLLLLLVLRFFGIGKKGLVRKIGGVVAKVGLYSGGLLIILMAGLYALLLLSSGVGIALSSSSTGLWLIALGAAAVVLSKLYTADQKTY